MASALRRIRPPAQARLSYLALFSIRRSLTTSSRKCADSSTLSSGQFHRSDFSGQGFTGYYEPGQPTAGPLGSTSDYGIPFITPKLLKQHLDQFVIGQERAKKVLSVAVYNHYARIKDIERREDEEEALMAQQERRAIAGRHPVEDEFPGQTPTVDPSSTGPSSHPRFAPTTSLPETSSPNIEKSNVLLLGPSGVGKTLMTKTLAKVLEVPFSISDCTPFTQAGYIGEDADVCIQRLLAAADYDVARAERGIICLDEVDKIATAKVSHGKDVSGEGVQQALLKIIEGTTVQVQAKQEKGSASPTSGRSNASLGGFPANGPGQQQQPQKGEIYNVNTQNILFICTGAFIGLHKLIMERIAKGSIGFGARVSSPSSSGDTNDPSVRRDVVNDELFRKHLPFYTSESDTFASTSTNPSATPSESGTAVEAADEDAEPPTYNALDLATPADLQKYGLIPELIGRIPVTCSLAQLSLSALVRVLTEPKNSLVSQYAQLFALSGVELRFTTPALREIAKAARGMGTGARGLRTIMERLLGEAMFEAPGSGCRYCLITESVAKKERAPILLNRGMQSHFDAVVAHEEEEWDRRRGIRRNDSTDHSGFSSFEQYREKAKIAGSG